jgi:hypothetical protein
LTTSFRRYIILEKGVNMGNPQLEQLRTEFLTLEAHEKDYILGVSSALAFSLQCKSGELHAEGEQAAIQGTLPNENASGLAK